MEPTDTPGSLGDLRTRLAKLSIEHREIDEAITRMATSPPDDQLILRRLKKRKLLIKDSIIAIERLLNADPDEYA